MYFKELNNSKKMRLERHLMIYTYYKMNPFWWTEINALTKLVYDLLVTFYGDSLIETT